MPTPINLLEISMVFIFQKEFLYPSSLAIVASDTNLMNVSVRLAFFPSNKALHSGQVIHLNVLFQDYSLAKVRFGLPKFQSET